MPRWFAAASTRARLSRSELTGFYWHSARRVALLSFPAFFFSSRGWEPWARASPRVPQRSSTVCAVLLQARSTLSISETFPELGRFKVLKMLLG